VWYGVGWFGFERETSCFDLVWFVLVWLGDFRRLLTVNARTDCLRVCISEYVTKSSALLAVNRTCFVREGNERQV
jgi:hypothetical protein